MVAVTTERTVSVSAADAFDALMFYEEVRHPPPLILRVGLARPLRTTGSSRTVGDVKNCIYNKGHITKRVTSITADSFGPHAATGNDIRIVS